MNPQLIYALIMISDLKSANADSSTLKFLRRVHKQAMITMGFTKKEITLTYAMVINILENERKAK